jgi:hypothetical protein
MVGRFPSLDPKADAFPFVSPYNYAENRPIDCIDLWGLQAVPNTFLHFYPEAGEVYTNGEAQVYSSIIDGLTYLATSIDDLGGPFGVTGEGDNNAIRFHYTKGFYPGNPYTMVDNTLDEHLTFWGGVGTVYGAASAVKGISGISRTLGKTGNVTDDFLSASTFADDISETGANFGTSTTSNYKSTFFKAYPELKGEVFVHHAVEQQALKRYSGLISKSEMHSLENLRGIPIDLNNDIHLSQIRRLWNQFYRTVPNPNQQQLLDKATQIDQMFGKYFKPPK